MANNKRTIYLGLDYSQFSGGITEINRKMGLLDAEFKRAQEEAKNYGNEADQLGIKQDYLTQKIALQNKKVEEAKDAYDAAMSSNKASQKEIDELDKKLLQERTKLEQLNGALKETYNKTVDLDGANKKLNDTIKEFAIGATAALGALSKFAVDTAKTADDLQTLASQTGMTTTEIQRLQYASEFVDVSFDTMASSITKLESNMDKARNGSKEMTEAFRKLHVRVTDNNGQLKDANALFYEIIDKLKGVKNQTERDALAMELFGKSAKDLNPLIEAGSQALKEYGDEAERYNLVMSEEEIEKNVKFGDTLARLKAIMDRLKQVLGEAIMPILENLADFLTKIDIKTVAIIGAGLGIVTLIYKIATAIGAVTTVMAAQTGVQTVFNAATLKSIAVIMGMVVAIGLLVYLISQLVGKTEDAEKNLTKVETSVGNITKEVTNMTSAANAVGRNASGTDHWKGGRTWVGEEGPEIVELPRGSRIIPNKQASQISNATNNYYITIDAKNVSDFNRVVDMANQMQMATRRI